MVRRIFLVKNLLSLGPSPCDSPFSWHVQMSRFVPEMGSHLASYGGGGREVDRLVSFWLQHFVYQSILLCFFGGHVVVAFGVLAHFGERLTGVGRKDFV